MRGPMQRAADFERVTATGLVKTWGATRALSGVDLALGCGEVVVVSGPNGAGKSTLLSVLAQLARPTSGEVRYGRLEASEARAQIGVVAHASMLYADLTGRENLELARRLHGVAGHGRTDALVDRFDLGPFYDRPVRTYSRGQLQRTSLARALVHSPRLVLYDEPSTGLDERSLDRLVDLVEAERDRGAIQLVITHDPQFASRVATRRVHLVRGRIKEALS